MKTAEIKTALLEGKNFGNDSSNWFTLCKPSENRFIIMIGDKILTYKNVDSTAKRVLRLINKGY